MANAMNFTAASTPPNNLKKYVRRGITPSRPKIVGSVPVEPSRDNTKKNQYDALMKLYKTNKDSYNKTKVGKKWKESYIKTGGGYVDTDFGDGNRGAAIPYSIGQRDLTRVSDTVAKGRTDGNWIGRSKADMDKAAKEEARKDAIKRRQKKK